MRIVLTLITIISCALCLRAQDYVFLPVAMQREAAPLLGQMENKERADINGFCIYTGKIGNNDVIAGISGPGLINMSSMMSMVCGKYSVKAVINYGMVGGYGKHIHKNDIIICTEAMSIASYMTSRKKTGINIRKWNYITFTDGGKDELQVYAADSALASIPAHLPYPNSIHRGRIGSADIWNNERKMIRMLMDRYSIICEDMEAVAVYQLSQRFGIPCISIKGVSDNCFLGEEYDDSVLPGLNDFVIRLIKDI